jgi:hypothetical protein
MTLFADKTLVRFARTAEKRCALLLWAAARDGAADTRFHEQAEDARFRRAAFSAWRMRLVELRRARARAEHQAARIFVRSLAHRVEAWCHFTVRRRAMAREVQAEQEARALQAAAGIPAGASVTVLCVFSIWRIQVEKQACLLSILSRIWYRVALRQALLPAALAAVRHDSKPAIFRRPSRSSAASPARATLVASRLRARPARAHAARALPPVRGRWADCARVTISRRSGRRCRAAYRFSSRRLQTSPTNLCRRPARPPYLPSRHRRTAAPEPASCARVRRAEPRAPPLRRWSDALRPGGRCPPSAPSVLIGHVSSLLPY